MIKSNSRHISPCYIDEAETIYTSDIYEFCAHCEQCISECCCDEATKIESDGTSLRFSDKISVIKVKMQLRFVMSYTKFRRCVSRKSKRAIMPEELPTFLS
ncbi:10340_t:CDS:2 [Paraglomus occultum]|uniref:10340_t:CDS:1 n=1 Tax=Paraglomus occultum TaxID=144539 RepID=A0A9N9FBK5_9GLOM|nr:10340_t:CDS:2 [Paraglomus occultum]